MTTVYTSDTRELYSIHTAQARRTTLITDDKQGAGGLGVWMRTALVASRKARAIQ